VRNLILFAFFLPVGLLSQRNLKDSSITTILFAPNYKFNLTGGDMMNRWGYNSLVGLTFGTKLKSNLTLAADGGFLFGNQLRDTLMFESLYNSVGTVTSLSGKPGEVLFLMRGASAHIDVGYVFSRLGGVNSNSGLWITAGAGYLMHKIHIESLYDQVPQLEGKYKKLYDKLTMGFSAKQFVGYLYQSNKFLLNFYAGVEFTEGFTKNIRVYNVDTGGPQPEYRFDTMCSFKVGWLIPMYKRAPKPYYYD